jgi:hypothetical protein
MIAVLLNQLAQLLEAVFHDVVSGFCAHAGEGFEAPGGDFQLHQDAVTIAVVENALVLRPMNSGEDAVQILQIAVIVLDPFGRLGHAEFGIASGHALDPHQAHGLSIEVELAIFDFELANAEACFALMFLPAVGDLQFEPVQVWRIEMPELRVCDGCVERQSFGRAGLDRKLSALRTGDWLPGCTVEDPADGGSGPGLLADVSALR